jgi:hypothetical protein
MKKHYRHDKNCLNCGAELQGHFCHQCGQENLEVKEPFWHFFSHSISHYFHFDDKFFSTIRPLLTQPGYLTQQYLEGKRTRFLHPVSMYIFVSIVYFLVVPGFQNKEKDDFNLSGGTVQINGDSDTTYKKGEEDTIRLVKKSLKNVFMGDNKINAKVQKELDRKATKIKEKKNNAQFSKLPFAKQTLIINDLKTQLKTNPNDSLQDQLDYFTKIHTEREDSTIESYNKRQSLLPDSDKDGSFDSFFKRKEIDFKQKTKKDWSFKKEFEHYQSKLYFILMPLLAFFLMLNFRKNHRYYVEHIVFTIHIFTAFFIFETFAVPINYLVFHNNSEIYKIIIDLIMGWDVYTALRVFYNRKPWATIRKMVTLVMMYSISFGIALSIISAIIYLNVYLSQ